MILLFSDADSLMAPIGSPPGYPGGLWFPPAYELKQIQENRLYCVDVTVDDIVGQ